MKTLILAALLFVLSVSPCIAHPGKTDRQGGHKCYKECEEWKLYYMEYHLHDKDGRPVRVEKRRKRELSSVASMATPTEVPPIVTSITNTVTVYRDLPVQEGNLLFPNPLLYILLLLFLLLLILRMNRNREE
jgi:hypothetical protein